MSRKVFMQDIRKKSISELVQDLKKFKKDLYRLRMDHKTQGVKEVHTFKQLRKSIARVQTVLSSLRTHGR